MESHFSYRWYGTNKKGEHTFYIEVYATNIMDELFFNTSLPIEIFSEPGKNILVNKLCKKDTSNFERNKIAENLILEIEHISAIQKHFFSDNLLDIHGKYSEAYQNIIQEISKKDFIEEFVPYSEYHNEIIFDKLTMHFNYNEAMKECLFVEREYFEEKIAGHAVLQIAYSEIYTQEAEYLYELCMDETSIMEYYCVTINEKLALVFFTKLEKITTLKM